jgi:hypothetical protein
VATIVNTPGSAADSGGSGFAMGMVAILIIVLLFVFFGLPMLRRGVGSTQVNIPDQVDVNVQGGGSGGQ